MVTDEFSALLMAFFAGGLAVHCSRTASGIAIATALIFTLDA
jgi:hypothetical protein